MGSMGRFCFLWTSFTGINISVGVFSTMDRDANSVRAVLKSLTCILRFPVIVSTYLEEKRMKRDQIKAVSPTFTPACQREAA